MSRRFIGTGLGRRMARSVPAQPAPPILAYGLSGWDTSTALAAAGGIAGDTGGVWVASLVRLDAVPTGTQIIAQKSTSTTGWVLASVGADLRFVGRNGSGGQNSPLKTWGAGDVGKLHVIGGCVDVANGLVRLFANALEIGEATALTGYSASGSSQSFGSTPTGTQPATSYTILGLVGGNGPMTEEQFAALCSASKAAHRIEAGGLTPTAGWRVPAGLSGVPNTLDDFVGSADLSFAVGDAENLVYETLTNPAWAF